MRAQRLDALARCRDRGRAARRRRLGCRGIRRGRARGFRARQQWRVGCGGSAAQPHAVARHRVRRKAPRSARRGTRDCVALARGPGHAPAVRRRRVVDAGWRCGASPTLGHGTRRRPRQRRKYAALNSASLPRAGGGNPAVEDVGGRTRVDRVGCVLEPGSESLNDGAARGAGKRAVGHESGRRVEQDRLPRGPAAAREHLAHDVRVLPRPRRRECRRS